MKMCLDSRDYSYNVGKITSEESVGGCHGYKRDTTQVNTAKFSWEL